VTRGGGCNNISVGDSLMRDEGLVNTSCDH
jgi:hypothetical protein